MKSTYARNVSIFALVLSMSLGTPVEAKKRFSIKRLVGNVITAPLWVTEETIRHACVAYCYSRIHGIHDPWQRIAAEVSREKILLERKEEPR